MAHYQQLTIEEREKILTGLWERRSLRDVVFVITKTSMFG